MQNLGKQTGLDSKTIACVASISNHVPVQKLEWKQKSYEFCIMAALHPVSKSSLQYMPLTFYFKKLTNRLSMPALASVEYWRSDLCWRYLQ